MSLKKLRGLLAVLALTNAGAYAEVPELVNYQGRLTNSAGNPVTDSTYSVTVTIYDAPVGGTNLWSEMQSVTTSDGLFSVQLGTFVTLPDNIFDGISRYLSIQVNPDGEILPRQRLVSTPYSYRVRTVDGATGGVISGDVDIQSELTVSGNVGIGTTSPGSRLTVQGPESSRGLRVTDGSSISNVVIQPLDGSNSGFQAINFNGFRDFSEQRFNTSKNRWRLYVDQRGGSDFFSIDTYDGVGTSNLFSILSNGKVGIGTANPLHNFDILSTGDLYMNLRAGSSSNAAAIVYRHGSTLMWEHGMSGLDRYYIFNYTRVKTDFAIANSTGNVGIGTESPQGALDVSSTTGAFIVPRMTTAQRDALTAVNGMIIYNTTTNQFNFFEAGAWVIK